MVLPVFDFISGSTLIVKLAFLPSGDVPTMVEEPTLCAFTVAITETLLFPVSAIPVSKPLTVAISGLLFVHLIFVSSFNT